MESNTVNIEINEINTSAVINDNNEAIVINVVNEEESIDFTYDENREEILVDVLEQNEIINFYLNDPYIDNSGNNIGNIDGGVIF